VQRLYGHVELVAVGIVEHEKFAGVARDIHGLQTDVPSHAVRFMHHRRSDPKIGKLLEDFRRVALGAAPAALLPRAIAEQLRLGENLQGRRFQAQSGHCRRYGNAEFLSAGEKARKGVENLGLNAAAAQQVEQQFAASRRFRREQHSRVTCGEVRLEFGRRLFRPCIDAYRGRRRTGEIVKGSLRVGWPFEGP
jgi:hypothetical protein